MKESKTLRRKAQQPIQTPPPPLQKFASTPEELEKFRALYRQYQALFQSSESWTKSKPPPLEIQSGDLKAPTNYILEEAEQEVAKAGLDQESQRYQAMLQKTLEALHNKQVEDQVAQLRHQLFELQATKHKMHQQNQLLNKKLEGVELQKEQQSDMSKEINRLLELKETKNQELEEALQERDSMHGSINTLHSQLEQLNNNFAKKEFKLNQQVESLNKRLKMSEEERSLNIKTQKQDLLQKQTFLQEQKENILSHWELENSELKGLYDQVEAKNNLVRQEIKKLNERKAKLLEEKNLLKQEKLSYQGELQMLKDNQATLSLQASYVQPFWNEELASKLDSVLKEASSTLLEVLQGNNPQPSQLNLACKDLQDLKSVLLKMKTKQDKRVNVLGSNCRRQIELLQERLEKNDQTFINTSNSSTITDRLTSIKSKLFKDTSKLRTSKLNISEVIKFHN